MKKGWMIGLGFWALVLGTVAQGAAGEGTLKSFAQEPAFRNLLGEVSRMARESGRKLAAMTPQERKGFEKAVDRYLKSNPAPSPQNVPQELRGVVGMTATEGRDLQQSLKELKGGYPEINRPAQVGQVVAYGFFQSEYSFSDIEPDYCQTAVCQCQANCDEQYRLDSNQAGYEWIGDSLRDPTAFFGNYFAMARKLNQAGEAMVQCKIDCRGGQLNPGQCQVHEDCNDDQYCHKSLGNPYHSCWPKKDLGQACSGDVKCKSGCCKYHLPSNPIQPVCRPTDRCN